MGTFALGGATIVAPGILVTSEIGAARVLQLLPFGTIAMVGASDGGAGDGAVYSFTTINAAQRVLRSGPLLDALTRAANIGGASGFIGVVAGTKTSATLALTGASSGTALPRSVTVTPASMGTGVNTIEVGDTLYIDYGTAHAEEVVVTAVTGTTFTAEFTLPHAAGFTIKTNPLSGFEGVTTEAITLNSTAQAITVTGTLTDGQEGDHIVIDTGSNQEVVQVTAIDAGAGTITGIFTKNHASGVAYAEVAINTTAPTAIVGLTTPTATLAAGDQGTWTNGIAYTAIAGTADNSVAVTISYPDPVSGQTVYIGGLNTPFDNLTSYSDLAAAILANNVLTPGSATGLPPIVVLTVTTDGVPGTLEKTFLSGGTGSGSQALMFADFETAINNMIDVDFDIAHLVQCYSAETQAYADAQAQQVQPYGRLRRWVHQVVASGAAVGQSKTVNSEAVANALIEAATTMNSIRSSFFAQQINYLNPNTGGYQLVDAAPFFIGLAALLGATGPNGPATPLTFEVLPGVTGIDYPVLETTGDLANAILGGGIVLAQTGTGANASVKVVQSVTSAPNDANGNPWIFGEFSVVRVADALLANCIAACETSNPKVVGAGNTAATQQAALADVRDVLEDALENTWITTFDPNSLSISQTGSTGEDDILTYSAQPTLPLNHLGIEQTLIPFSGPVATGGTVNG